VAVLLVSTPRQIPQNLNKDNYEIKEYIWFDAVVSFDTVFM
jgi:hypothetical protein